MSSEHGTKQDSVCPEELRDAGLLDFFASDPCPTIVLDQQTRTPAGNYAIAYKNAATTKIIDSTPKYELVELATSIENEYRNHKACVLVEFAGRSWAARAWKERWVVVSTQDPADVRTLSGEDVEEPKNVLDWLSPKCNNRTPFQQLVVDQRWHETELGPIAGWSATLRQLVLSAVSNPEPRLILWGPHSAMVYNEACAPIMGQKHPLSMGNRGDVVWSEIWSSFSTIVEAARLHGRTTALKSSQLTMERHGYKEETWWDYTILPIVGPDGRGLGAIDEFVERTADHLAERRRASAVRLSDSVSTAITLPELWQKAAATLDADNEDVPYALIYVATREDDSGDEGTATTKQADAPGVTYVLEATTGLPAEGVSTLSFRTGDDASSSKNISSACRNALTVGDVTFLSTEDQTMPKELNVPIAGRGFGDQITRAAVIPIPRVSSDGHAAILILGMNPRRPVDDACAIFVQSIHDVLTKASVLISLPQEQRRVQQRYDAMQTSLSQRLHATTLEARRHEARFARLAEIAPFGIYIIDRDLQPTFVNEQYLAHHGIDGQRYKQIVASKYNWKGIIHDNDEPLVHQALGRILIDKKMMSVEYRILKPWKTVDQATGRTTTGETWLYATAVPELDEYGNVVSIQGWTTDISQRIVTQKLLAERLDEVTEAKRQTENFIDMTSHEMRNPLSAILQSADGILSTLDAAGVPLLNEAMAISQDTIEGVLDAAQTIILCAQHQKRIVDDILTLSKLDSSLLVIAPDQTQPQVILEKALKMFEAELERAGIEASLDIEQSYRDLDVDSVMIDGSRILQVVINLLTNAIKFTQYSDTRQIQLVLGASLDRPQGHHHNVHFIPQHTRSPSRDLSLEWGQGREIYLQFAVRDTGQGLTEEDMKSLFLRFSQASPKTYKKYGGSGLGLFISRELIELQGGQIGVSSVHGQGSTFTFYVKARKYVPGTPLVTNSNRGMRELPQPSLSLAPVPESTQGSVQLPVRSVVKKKASTKFQAAPGLANGNSAKVSESLSILIVEDNEINAKVMAKQIKSAGHSVHVANHGGEALDFLEKTIYWSSQTNGIAGPNFSTTDRSDSRIPLSVILMDLEMPVMDGLTCVRKIREYEKTGQITSRIPIIAATANARSEQIVTALQAGMDEVITKPFRINQLLERAMVLAKPPEKAHLRNGAPKEPEDYFHR